VEEHEGVFVVVCVEEGSRDVNCGYIAAFVSINSGSDHNAVGSNSKGGAVFLFVTGFPAFLAAVSAHAGAHALSCFLMMFVRDSNAVLRLMGLRELALRRGCILVSHGVG
jgi:hypothetical protein